ncbi:MAG: UbiA family prenyltransferase [Candidatus Helarchaeota archaeon]
MTGKNSIISFIKNLRILRTLSYLLMYFFGWFFGWYFSLYNIDYIKLIIGLISIFFCWQFCISLNDIFDIEIDRITNPDRPYVKGYLGKKKYIIISLIYVIISIISSIFLGFVPLILISIFLFLGYIYSAPPIRMRKYIIGTLFIGGASALSYFAGLYSINNIINLNQLTIGILIFFALSMGTVVKDYKDYEGDKKAGVSTIFTKFGLEKGTRIASILLLITFLLPFILINHLYDFLILIPTAILVVVLFNLKKVEKKTQITLIIFFIEIIYIFLRVIGVIVY